MLLLCLGPIIKHAAILLIYLQSPKTNTKTKACVRFQEYGVAVFTFLLLTATPFSRSLLISVTSLVRGNVVPH